MSRSCPTCGHGARHARDSVREPPPKKKTPIPPKTLTKKAKVQKWAAKYLQRYGEIG